MPGYQEPATLVPANPERYRINLRDFAVEYTAFKRTSRTARILSLLERKSVLAVDKDASELLPSIDLFAGYIVDGDEYTLTNKDRTAVAGVSVEWPFPDKVDRARFRTAQIDLKTTRLESENVHRALYTDLKNLYRQIAETQELLALAQKKITLAEEIVKDETKNYSYGKVSLKDLIDEVNNLEDAKFSRITLEIRLKRLTVEWLRLSDRLVSRQDLPTLQ